MYWLQLCCQQLLNDEDPVNDASLALDNNELMDWFIGARKRLELKFEVWKTDFISTAFGFKYRDLNGELVNLTDSLALVGRLDLAEEVGVEAVRLIKVSTALRHIFHASVRPTTPSQLVANTYRIKYYQNRWCRSGEVG